MEEQERKLMGQRIRSERELCGFSQDQLAEKLKMNRTNISNYESGRTIPPGNIIRDLANIFDVDSDWLLGISDVKSAANIIDDKEISVAPDWATAKDKRDLKKFIESPEGLYFDGIEFDAADRDKLIGMMEAMFWEARLQNKETYKKSRTKKKDE